MDSDLPNADSQLHVEFYISKRENSAGKPYCKIMVPGAAQTLVWDQPVRELDKQRFPRQWLYFQQTSGNMPVTGIPLSEWRTERPEEISEGQVEELKSLRFQTVDHVATATDMQLQRIMGGSGLRSKAQEYLKVKTRKASSAEMDELKAMVAKQQEQIAQLLAKPKPGPKPKNVEA